MACQYILASPKILYSVLELRGFVPIGVLARPGANYLEYTAIAVILWK